MRAIQSEKSRREINVLVYESGMEKNRRRYEYMSIGRRNMTIKGVI
jgi:hypothetical protein